jgi:ribosomal protein S5
VSKIINSSNKINIAKATLLAIKELQKNGDKSKSDKSKDQNEQSFQEPDEVNKV